MLLKKTKQALDCGPHGIAMHWSNWDNVEQSMDFLEAQVPRKDNERYSMNVKLCVVPEHFWIQPFCM